MSVPRRAFIRSLCSTAAVFTLDQLLSGKSLDVEFVRDCVKRLKTKPFTAAKIETNIYWKRPRHFTIMILTVG